MAKRCRSCCTTPSCLVKLPTLVCDPHGFAATGRDGVTVTLKDGGGSVVSTGTSAGMVGALTLGAHGTGYTSAPTVTFSAPPAGGIQAHATCTISGGTVNALTLTDPGLGYTAAPTVGFSGGGGSGATASLSFAHGARLTAPGAATYTATCSLAGYRTATASVTVSSCAALTTAAAQTMDTTVAGWPVTPLSCTDSVFGAFTLTNAGGYTVTKTVSGTVITQCGLGAFATATGNFDLKYQLSYSSCGIQLAISWTACDFAGCNTGTGPPDGNTPPVPSGTVTSRTSLLTLDAASILTGPLQLTYTVPSLPDCRVDTSGGAFVMVPTPYPSGASITMTGP